MRLFIAIEFNDDIITSLKGIQQDLKSCGLKGRYTREENLHLTLAFIGDYGSPEDVLDAMDEVDFEEFPIELSGIGNFGDLYWVGLADNPYLGTLVKRLRKSLSEHGIPFDRKKFSPHVTLVRRGEFTRGRAELPEVMPEASMMVRSIALVRSEPGKNGMNYTVLGETPQGCSVGKE